MYRPLALSLLACLPIGGVVACGSDKTAQTAQAPTSVAVATAPPAATAPVTTLPATTATTTTTTPSTSTPSSTTSTGTTPAAAPPSNPARPTNPPPAFRPTTTQLAQLGQPASPEVRTAVIDAAQGFYRAAATGDGAKLCGLLSSAAQRQLTQVMAAQARGRGLSCSQTMDKLFAGRRSTGRAPPGPRYTAVRVRGQNAYAVLSQAGYGQYMTLVDEQGTWKLATLTPSSLVTPPQNGPTGTTAR